MSVNKVILLGYIASEIEVKQISPDYKVANFTLATSEKYTAKDGEKVETTEWHKCQASNRTAEVVEKYTQKGDQLYVEGKIKTRSWENKEGVKQYLTYIQVDLVQLFPKRKEPELEQYRTSSPAYEEKSIKQQIAERQANIPENEDPDGLPF